MAMIARNEEETAMLAKFSVLANFEPKIDDADQDDDDEHDAGRRTPDERRHRAERRRRGDVPGGGSPGVRATTCGHRQPVPLDVDGGDDDHGLHHPGVGVGQVVADQRGEDELHQQGAGHRPEDAQLAAGERRPADDDRGDRAELDQQTDERRIGGADRAVARIPATAASVARQGIDEDQRATHREPGGACRVGAAADRRPPAGRTPWSARRPRSPP